MVSPRPGLAKNRDSRDRGQYILPDALYQRHQQYHCFEHLAGHDPENALRQRAEALATARTHELSDRERTLQRLMDLVPVGIFRSDAEGRCTYANAHWSRIAQISRAIGDQALALEGGLQQGFAQRLGPTTAEAAAAAETARLMAASIAERRMSLAKQAIAFAKAADSQAKHEKGPIAGLMSLLVRDVWGRGRLNVDTQTEVIEASLYRLFNDGIEALKSRAAGLSQNVASARNLVRELFGEDSGDEIAKAAAKGWQDATGEAVRRAKDAGRVFNVLDDWRLPQFWTGERIVRRKAEWLADVRA